MQEILSQEIKRWMKKFRRRNHLTKKSQHERKLRSEKNNLLRKQGFYINH